MLLLVFCTVYGRFPENHFPGKTFPGKDVSRRDVSRKVTFPENRFPEKKRFPERRFPESHFPGKTFPERSFKHILALIVFGHIVRGGFRILERGSFREEYGERTERELYGGLRAFSTAGPGTQGLPRSGIWRQTVSTLSQGISNSTMRIAQSFRFAEICMRFSS